MCLNMHVIPTAYNCNATCSKPQVSLQACMLVFVGESVAKYIREPSPFNTQIVSLGVDTYLKMLLADNFVHTDLHPGNIMVRIRGVRCFSVVLAI